MFTSSSAQLPHRKVALVIADALLIPGALMLTVAFHLGATSFRAELGGHALVVPLLWLVSIPSFYFFGLYDTSRLQAFSSMVVPAVVGAVVTGAIDAAVLRVALPLPQALSSELLVTGLVLAAILLTRLVHLQAARHGIWSSRALVVGDWKQVQEVSDLLGQHPHSGIKVIGVVDVTDPGPMDRRRREEFPRLGGLADLDRLAASLRVGHVILGAGLERDPAILRRLRPIRYRGTAILDFVTLYERLALEISIAHIDDIWLFAAAMNSSRFHARWLKRMLDVVAAILLLIPTGLFVLPVAALAIRLTSKGPVLFRQERLGLGARPFMMLKLRTMRIDAESLTGPIWSMENDPRITPVGKVLRKFRIDELPQLWNVLVGEMSLIGPRPERDVFVRELSATLPLFSERLLVRPGITGWAQVMAPYASSVADSYRKLQFDLYYAKHMSLFLDALIVVKTVKTMLLGRERSQGGMEAGKQVAVPLNTSSVPMAAISLASVERVGQDRLPIQLPLVS